MKYALPPIKLSPDMTAKLPKVRGKHCQRLMSFCAVYPGAHCLTANRSDPAHKALESLVRRGILVRSVVGRAVFAELAAKYR